MLVRARSLLGKSILSYLILFVLFLGFGLSGYIRSNQLLEGETRAYNLTILVQKQQEIDARLEEIHKLISRVSLNNRITNFVYATPDMGNDYYYRMHLALSEVTAFSLTHAFVHDLYIYHRRGAEILSSAGVYDLENFYTQQTQYADLSFAAWRDMIDDTPRLRRTYPAQRVRTGSDGEKTILTVLSPLPNFTLGQQNNATLVVMIDGDKILDILLNDPSALQGAVYIVNAQGKIMLSGGAGALAAAPLSLPDAAASFTTVIDGVSMAVASAPSHVTDWRYVSVLPQSLLMQQVDRTRLFSNYFIGGSVVLGLLLVITLAYINYRPIQNTIRTLQTTVPGDASAKRFSNEMDYIEHVVRDALKENQAMRRSYQAYLPVLQADTLKQLLHGEFPGPDEAGQALSAVGIRFGHEGFLAVYFAVESDGGSTFGNDWSLMRFVITNVVEETFEGIGACYVLSLGAQSLCAVINCAPADFSDPKSLQPLLGQLQNTLCNRCQLPLTFGISEMQQKPQSLNTALIQAQQAQEYCMYHTASSYRFFREINTGVSYYPFSMELEQQLLASVKAGNQETVDRLLDQIYSAYPAQAPSLEVSRCVFFDLMGTALKLLSSLDIDYKQVFGGQDPFGMIYACKTVPAMRRTTHMLFTILCDHLNAGRSSHTERLRDALMEYIDRHYADPNLSLTTVADAFGLSSSYLSHFVKQNASDNFVSLLRARRIRQVETMLTETHLTIEEIARATGYASGIVLTRNFKKVHSIAPGQYREMKR